MMRGTINGLALFAGVGGLELGLHRAIPHYHTRCFVELAEYPASVLAARMRDGGLPPAPIWDDVRTFDPSCLRSPTHIVTAGFPCQPFSSASRGRARGSSAWPEVERLVAAVKPALVFLENVPQAPWSDVRSSLERLGFDHASRVFCSSEVFCPARRKRVFLLAAHPHRNCEPVGPLNAETPSLPPPPAPSPRPKSSRRVRVVDGVANRMDRMQAAGNAVIPEMATAAFLELFQQLHLAARR